MSAFPTSIPIATNSNTTDTLAAAAHTGLHNNLSAEVTAIATKLGAGASVPAANTVLHGGLSSSTWDVVNLVNDVTGVLPTSHGGTGTISTDGTGSVVFSNNPTLVGPTLTGSPSLQGGGVWSGGPTINQPTITDFTNSNHNHSNTVGGGLIKNPCKFSVVLTTGQTIGSNVETLIQFNAVEFDTGTNVDTSTNKGRFTAPFTGVYFFNAAVALNQGNYVLLEIRKNGFTIKQGNEITSSAGSMAATVSALASISAGDYIEIYALSPSANIPVDASGTFTYFQGFLVSI